MAEGGYENTGLDWDIHDDDDEEEEEEEEEDTTTPFQHQPVGTSTPYHGGEEHEMHTLPREQSGLDDTDPLLAGDVLSQRLQGEQD